MKILESQSATLTNYEVLTHLNALAAKNSPSPSQPTTTTSSPPQPPALKSPNYETITKQLLHYLSPIPSPSSSSSVTSSTNHTTHPPPPPSPLPPYNNPSYYNPSSIRALLLQLEPYELTKAELLMVANLRPADVGFLDAVVEECDARFSEEEQGAILGVVGEVLGREEEGEGEAEGEAEMGEG